MALEILNSYEPVSQKQLADFEKRNHLSLPPQYRAFLLKHNGGVPNKPNIDFLVEKGPYTDAVIQVFLQIFRSNKYAIY